MHGRRHVRACERGLKRTKFGCGVIGIAVCRVQRGVAPSASAAACPGQRHRQDRGRTNVGIQGPGSPASLGGRADRRGNLRRHQIHRPGMREAGALSWLLFYVVGCIIILGFNYDFIIPAIKTICQTGTYSAGRGCRRPGRYPACMTAMPATASPSGLFSNESGMGSAPIVAACCSDPQPCPPGTGFLHRNLLGYGCRMSYDRTGARHQHHEKSGH